MYDVQARLALARQRVVGHRPTTRCRGRAVRRKTLEDKDSGLWRILIQSFAASSTTLVLLLIL